MRIALVSPYSWSYPGGVTRHIQALAEQFVAAGHHVRVLAPVDPDDRLGSRLHRGARPEVRDAPDYLVPLGRTVGFPANGAVSNLLVTPTAVGRLRTELASGGFDVVHVHEPIAPLAGWDALVADLPLVGTFHCYSANPVTNNLGNVTGAWLRLGHLRERIAVSAAARWTAERFYGGTYRVIPNGVHLDEDALARPPGVPDAGHAALDPLRIAFIGQAVERKGLPV
ncbi:MAG: glycosyltransferase family 4 protein, partial [Solirubrobacterales bacterium]|nr:glycosyltransferase family 4 protein [Solirubrobacterales bacterium]